MTFFACAVRTDAGPVPGSFRTAIERARRRHARAIRWHTGAGFVAGVDPEGAGAGIEMARVGTAIAVGRVRLDNRSEVATWTACRDSAAGDLELATRFLLLHDGERADRLLGDFAFVIWNPAARKLMAARDAFGVRKLFYSSVDRTFLAFASHAEPLARGDRYDAPYLAARIAYCVPEPDRTAYAGVRALPPASVLRLRGDGPAVSTFWSAREAQAAGGSEGSAGDRIEAFRALLIESVRLRLPPGADTWSHLSGGLDSSSVVSVAQWLAQSGAVAHGLAGTVTYTDPLGTAADEREYSDAVARHWRVRNEQIPHRTDRRAIVLDPPILDQPDSSYQGAFRDRAVARLVRDAGGRVLLTGSGGDALVMGTMLFFADWFVTGRAWEAVREMARRAALGRVSFWELAWKNALLPLVPDRARSGVTSEGSIPAWIPRAAARRVGLGAGRTLTRVLGGRPGRKYEDATAAVIEAIPSGIPLGPPDEALDVRHPYLYRPLVELALRLSPEMCVRPHARKWILREAMRGILPDDVRTRVGKGTIDGLHAWSLAHDHEHVRRLLRSPILADLGCVDPKKLRAAYDYARAGSCGRFASTIRMTAMLDVELWLQLRSGRWAAEESQISKTRRFGAA